jgi:ATP-dependent DNA ligase
MSKYLNLKPVEFDSLSASRKAKIKWEGRILLPKYDGCMAIVGFWNGKPDFIISRTGEEVKSMGHMYDDVQRRFPELVSMQGGSAFIGEAWTPGKEFAEISGTFRRQRPQPELGFAVFDHVGYTTDNEDEVPELTSTLCYWQRLESLAAAATLAGGHCYAPLPVICADEAHALRYAKNLKAVGGYDGCVAGDPYATYTPGSGSNGEFLKVKPLLSFSLEVVGYEQAVGEKTGRPTGALAVRFKGTTCKVATGLSEDQQAHLGDFVGGIIEVQCMGVYPGDTGLMREPRFIGVRGDVLKADY